MKFTNILKLSSVVTIVTLSLSMFSCGDDENENAPGPSITTFSPESGVVGTTVTISGTNFSTTPSENVVQFNGASATVLTASATELTVTVPADATDGKISLTIHGKTTATTSDFTIPLPTITSTFPMIAAPGASVTIKGENFSPVAEDNIVKFNGVEATVTSADEGEITVTVPDGATTGTLTIDVGQHTAEVSFDFEICTGHAEVVISNVVLSDVGSTSYSVSFTMTNVGSTDVDASAYTMQNYASQDDVFGGGDKAASGYSLTSAPVLAPGESYTAGSFGCGISGGGNTTDYPYLIMQVYDNGSVEECNEENNTVVVLFK